MTNARETILAIITKPYDMSRAMMLDRLGRDGGNSLSPRDFALSARTTELLPSSRDRIGGCRRIM